MINFDIDSIERALLVNVVDKKSWDTIILNDLNEKYFTVANRPMFRYIKSYTDKNTYPDLKSLCYEYEIDYEQLTDYLHNTNLQSLCDTIRKEYTRSQIIEQVQKLNEKSDLLVDDAIKYGEYLCDIAENVKSISFTHKSVSLFEDIEQVQEIDPSNVISTGFDELDKKLIGWRRGEDLITFMARTGQGKSWFGLKFAMAAALKGEQVGIYSGEMSKQQLQERILCCAKPKYTSTKQESLEYIRKNNIDIRLITQQELRRRATVDDIEAMIIRDKLTMVVIDQLSLMEDKTNGYNVPLRQQYGNISMDLFNLSTKYGLPIILLAQSNRAGGQQINGPELENLAESDAVSQNSTRVISMKNDSGILTMQVLKNRYGESKGIQKYEVDFSINKYRPIDDLMVQSEPLRRAKARSIFGG